MSYRRDPFEFFRQYLPESQRRNITIEEERRIKTKAEYPFFTYSPLIVGILTGIYVIVLFLCFPSLDTVSQIKTMKTYTLIALSVNGIFLIFGIFAICVSNKKIFPIAGSILCFLTEFPLMGIIFTYLHYLSQHS
jgi:hypothetical protein